MQIGPVKIRKVSDFLQLVGMRVLFTTRLDGEFEATVRDLSDMGTHVLLDDVLSVEYSKEPYGKSVRVACRDIGKPGDLSKYVDKRIRLRMEPDGFVEGVLQRIPKTAKQVELAKMVTYYHPCDRHSLLISDLTFVEVTDRKEILF
jgi:hypothetical protein